MWARAGCLLVVRLRSDQFLQDTGHARYRAQHTAHDGRARAGLRTTVAVQPRQREQEGNRGKNTGACGGLRGPWGGATVCCRHGRETTVVRRPKGTARPIGTRRSERSSRN